MIREPSLQRNADNIETAVEDHYRATNLQFVTEPSNEHHVLSLYQLRNIQKYTVNYDTHRDRDCVGRECVKLSLSG
jgi:hypothetical protein